MLSGLGIRMKYSIISEMETFLLLLLGLGLALAGPSESIMEMMKEECVMEETQCATVESGQVKYTVGILMNLTLFDKNTSLRLLKDPMASSLLMFRGLSYSIPKGNILGSDKYYCDGMMTWRKVLEENRSCKLSNDFIHGFMGIIHKVSKASHWKCGQIPAVSYSESPGMQNVICKVTKGKQVPGCQSHSVTSLKKMLTVMTSHSLMSWLVSSSKL
uniref:probable ribonuclease 11 isoform X2 n=1 Tax=Jaculus jaculus TaxID=51337 RepID=UPI001E1B0FC2|nr:probable ribonuclease 11 isoform X2 [Jaculus jaculus]